MRNVEPSSCSRKVEVIGSSPPSARGEDHSVRSRTQESSSRSIEASMASGKRRAKAPSLPMAKVIATVARSPAATAIGTASSTDGPIASASPTSGPQDGCGPEPTVHILDVWPGRSRGRLRHAGGLCLTQRGQAPPAPRRASWDREAPPHPADERGRRARHRRTPAVPHRRLPREARLGHPAARPPGRVRTASPGTSRCWNVATDRALRPATNRW